MHIIIQSMTINISVNVIQGESQPVTTDTTPKITVVCDICGKKLGEYDHQSSANRALSVHQSQHCKGYPKDKPTVESEIEKTLKRRW